MAAESDSSHVRVMVVAGVVIRHQGKILLVQEVKPHVHGLWNFPGGHVDSGETIEEAAVREAKEETGLIVELDQALPVIHESIQSSVLHPFAAHLTGGELTVQDDEIMDAKWFTAEEIRAMSDKLRSPQYIFQSLDALDALI